jgi:hypothetical protein
MRTPEQLEAAILEMKARNEQKQLEAHRKSARDGMRKIRRTLERKNVKHVQAWRDKKRAEAKAAKRAANKAEKEARDARRVVRQEKQALDLRKHATERQGFCDGYNSTAPLSDAELKAQSWAKRYREAYAEGRAEKQRVDLLLEHEAAKRLTPTTPAAIIQLS